jgi:hypothetical protein
LGDAKPELEQLTLNARRAPKQVLRAHLPDQRAQFRLDRRSPLPVDAISNANSGESRPGANSPASQTSVATFKIDGKHRYIWTKNQRSLFVSRARRFSLRRNTTS